MFNDERVRQDCVDTENQIVAPVTVFNVEIVVAIVGFVSLDLLMCLWDNQPLQLSKARPCRYAVYQYMNSRIEDTYVLLKEIRQNAQVTCRHKMSNERERCVK